MFQNDHEKNVRVLLEKIEETDAVLVGAAAGMSAACGYNFFIRMTAIFRSIWESSMKSTDILELSMDFITDIRPERHIGHS